MNAFVYNSFGHADVLKLKEVTRPVPKEDEVLIRIKAISINKADVILMNGSPFLARPMVGNFFRPRPDMILGADVAGLIESVGSAVTDFKIGDAVMVDLSGSGFGGLAEYACAKASLVVAKPETLSFEEAAALPLAGVTALNAIKKLGTVRQGQTILINGASGGVGYYAVQIAKAVGLEVTAVCSARHDETVRSRGADHIIDYAKEDFTTSGKTYDFIHAVNGAISIFKYKKSLKPQGIYVMSGGAMSQMMEAMILGPLLSKKEGKQFRTVSSHADQQLLQEIAAFAAAGKIQPVIDRVFSFEETANAFDYFESGRVLGKIVIRGSE